MENQTMSNQKNASDLKALSLEEVMSRIEKLPDKIQKILLSDELADYFLELERQNNFNSAQADVMIDITHNVFLGEINPHVYLPVLSGELTDQGVNPIIAKEIAQKIESKFIGPVRDDLDKIYHRFKARGKLEAEIPSSLISTNEEKMSERGVEEAKMVVSEEKEAEEKKEIISEIKPEIKIEKPLEQIETPSITQEKIEQEQAPKKSFFSFLKFKRQQETPTQPTQPVIIGKETEVKPVLDKESPWVISFEDVKPTKEKVVSEVEIKTEPEIKPISIEKSFEPPKNIELPQVEEIFPKPLEAKEENKSASSAMRISPTKIVNYSAETPKTATPEQMLKTEPSIPAPQPPISEAAKPILEETDKKEPEKQEEKQKESTSEETTTNIPAENVIDLRKLKF